MSRASSYNSIASSFLPSARSYNEQQPSTSHSNAAQSDIGDIAGGKGLSGSFALDQKGRPPKPLSVLEQKMMERTMQSVWSPPPLSVQR